MLMIKNKQNHRYDPTLTFEPFKLKEQRSKQLSLLSSELLKQIDD